MLNQFRAHAVNCMTTVVAGIIEQHNRILIGRRRPDQPHPLKWEFPGGKLETGESPPEALVRELREELGIESRPGTELMRYEFSYPGKSPILLIFLRVTEWQGEIDNRIFNALEWTDKTALNNYDFLEGDLKFLAALTGPEQKTECREPDSKSS